MFDRLPIQNSRGDVARQRNMGIGDLLLENRIIFMDGVINDAVANVIVMKLLYLQSESRSQDIHMYVNSPGGSVTSTMAIYDTIHRVRRCHLLRRPCCQWWSNSGRRWSQGETLCPEAFEDDDSSAARRSRWPGV